MPSMNACVAWATPVHPVQLGAHFEAYVNLRPVVQALRLCHRFGTGESAAVTRLPVELVGIIEDYMMQEEREKQRAVWARDYRCWEACCGVSDHLTTDDLLELYNEYVNETCTECEGVCTNVADELDDERLAELKEYLGDFDEFGEEEIHYDQRRLWEMRVGCSGEEDRGFFTRFEQLFLKDFGLDVWISHSQSSHPKKDQRRDSGILASTAAFLVLPDSAHVKKDFDRRYPDVEDWGEEPPWRPTESGYGLVLAPPNRPSQASLQRFPRAMKLLGLVADAESDPVLYASGNDIENKSPDKHGDKIDDIEGQTNHADACLPQLRLLMSCKDQMDDLY